ncbi:unnamed protein product [Arabis nemorensis]|uniref:Uncharacterized protein n=1 Tax=Arabis nemorensis TaxID=586526 RepID=A0A565AWN7_9BRAS|nr:unnamed protein product [Arabis nemorensis]
MFEKVLFHLEIDLLPEIFVLLRLHWFVHECVRYLAISNMHTQVQINRDKESAPSAAPTAIYTTMYRSCVGVRFRLYLSWILIEYCELMQIAPSQLVLRAWGLIHALQVLSDLSGIDTSGKMVAHSFHLVSVEGNSRIFNLQLCEGESSPVDLPMWLDASVDGGEYFYVIHNGVGRVRSCWSDIGMRTLYPLYYKKCKKGL